MNPVISIWPLESTSSLAGKVYDLLKSPDFLSGLYRQLSPSDCDASLAGKIDQIHREMVRLDASDTSLHVVAVVLLSDKNVCGILDRIMTDLSKSRCGITLHIIGLHRGITRIIDPDHSCEAEGKDDSCSDAIHEIQNKISSSSSFPATFSIVDDYSESGASVGFSPDQLARFIAGFIRLVGQNYSEIFVPALVSEHSDNISGIGLAGIVFPRRRIVDYLMHKAFVSSLKEAGLDHDVVDIQMCQQHALGCLEDVDSFYSDFYRDEVDSRIEKKMDHGRIIEEIGPALHEKGNLLYENITADIRNESLSWPQREAIMAMIAGRDSDKFEGSLFIQKRKSLDDSLSEPIDIFISSYNELKSVEHNSLPLRGDYELLRYPDVDSGLEDEDGEPVYMEDPRNAEVFNPIENLKDIRAEILDVTSFIRSGTRDLESIRKNSESENLSSVVVRRPVSAVPERPLELTYEPAPSLKPAQSVDLRQFMTEIRDQGDVGACSTFAVIAMYEAEMNRGITDPAAMKNLSEGFLFYHTNVSKGRAEGGSNFYEQIEAMGQHGSCLASLHPFDRSLKPSDEATDEAKLHRILQARQINLVSSGDKFSSMTENHRLLTSALTEGHPVGIALRLFDDFGKHKGGHVPRPSDECVATPSDSAHAMVLVGYSEADNCYIVRNSWGKDFGENGYCYISSAYIDDAELNVFSCIITDTTEQPVGKVNIPALTEKFGGSESVIKAAAISNSLDIARIRHSALKRLYDEYYSYYRDLLARLSLPFTRKDILRMAVEKGREVVDEYSAKKNTLLDEHAQKLREFKRSYIKTGIYLTGGCMLAAAFAWLYYALGQTSETLIASFVTALAIVICVFYWINYKFAVRKRRREQQEEIERFASLENIALNDLRTKQLQFHVAGMVIDEVQKQVSRIEARYADIVSFCTNLRDWLDNDIRSENEDISVPDSTIISIENRDRLDFFYENNKKYISSSVDLLDIFDRYSVSVGNIMALRQQLEENVRKAITPLVAGFNMYDYLVENRKYEYLDEIDMQQIMCRLDRLANPLVRHNDNSVGNETRFLIASVRQDNMQKWRNACVPHFSYAPCFLTSGSSDEVEILTLRLLPPDTVK